METSKKIKLLDFKLNKALWASLFGLYKSKFSWEWIEFLWHREYEAWTPIKSIDWKASAKTSKIYSKVFELERNLKVFFVINAWKSMDFWVYDRSKRDVLEELFYSLAMSASMAWDSIGWVIDKDIFIDYEKWNWNIFKILDIIIWNAKETKKTSFDLYNVEDNLIFILTDQTDFVNDKNLKLLSLKNEVIFFNIFDYFENNLDNVDANLSFSSENSFLNIDLRDKKKVEAYKKERQEKLKKLEDYLRENNISYKAFDTKMDVFKELYLFFIKKDN